MISIKGFITANDNKFMTVRIWFLTAWYRFMLVALPRKNYQNKWGVLGEETPYEIELTDEQKHYVACVLNHVNHSGTKTPWKSLCLVRALTARHLLKGKQIPVTLYLGVGYDETGKTVAHAWTRVGPYYITGGNGVEYACVAKFANY